MSADRVGRRATGVAATIVVVLAMVAGLVWWFAPSRLFPWDSATFPEIDAARLSETQVRVLDLLEEQHRAQHPGTYYSEGVKEPWCADFVSWIMREAGVPLENPNSGHWRIPGVYTLQEYFDAAGRYESAGSGYVPRVGDVVLYENSVGFGERQHTNIVVAVDGDSAVTVGGNELGRIRVHDLDWADDGAVMGFGRLPV